MKRIVSLSRIVMILVFLNLLVFAAVAVVHEAGHFVLGQQLGCGQGKVILIDESGNAPYTEFSCPMEINEKIVYFSGLFTVMLFSIGFFLLRKPSEKNLFYIAAGFGVQSSAMDFAIISSIVFLPALINIAGLMILAFGEYAIAREYAKMFF